MALSGENGGYFVAPDFFHFGQNANLVIDKNVMISREATFHVIQFFFLVNIDQHIAIDRLINAGALNLARLENDIAVRKNCRWAPLLDMLNGIKRIWIES